MADKDQPRYYCRSRSSRKRLQAWKRYKVRNTTTSVNAVQGADRGASTKKVLQEVGTLTSSCITQQMQTKLLFVLVCVSDLLSFPCLQPLSLTTARSAVVSSLALVGHRVLLSPVEERSESAVEGENPRRGESLIKSVLLPPGGLNGSP